MRMLATVITIGILSLPAVPAEAQQYFMRHRLSMMKDGPSTGPYDGTWQTSDSAGGSCSLNAGATDMVKTVNRTASCTGGSCDPATKPQEGMVEASCRPVCDGTVQQKRIGRVVTVKGSSTQEVFLGHLGGPGWDNTKRIACEAQAVNMNQRLFGCTSSRISGASNAWIGDFSIPNGATTTNAYTDYVACRYE